MAKRRHLLSCILDPSIHDVIYSNTLMIQLACMQKLRGVMWSRPLPNGWLCPAFRML